MMFFGREIVGFPILNCLLEETACWRVSNQSFWFLEGCLVTVGLDTLWNNLWISCLQWYWRVLKGREESTIFVRTIIVTLGRHRKEPRPIEPL
jgi:hypothetical protein